MGDSNVSMMVPKLGAVDYAVWRERAQQALTIKGCWDAIEQDDPAQSAKARAYIGAWVEDYHLPAWRACATAREAWQYFERTHAASSAARLLQLRQQLNSLKMRSGEGVERYIARARTLWNQLTAAGGGAAAAAAAGQEADPVAAGQQVAPQIGGVTERDIVMAVLAGLPAEYSTLSTVLQVTRGVALTLEELTAAAVTEEAKNPTAFEPSGDKALFGGGGGRRRFGGRFGRGASSSGSSSSSGGGRPGAGGGNNQRCYYCNKKGHIQSECFKRKADLRRASQGGLGSGQFGSGHGGSGAYGGAVPALLAVPFPGCVDSSCSLAQSAAVPEPSSPALAAVTGSVTISWVLDSASKHHITGCKDILLHPHTLEKPIKIVGCGGTSLVDTVGDVMLLAGSSNRKLVLRGVAYLPGFSFNLLSTSKADKTAGARVSSGSGSMTVSLDGTALLHAQLNSEGVYRVSCRTQLAAAGSSAEPEAALAASSSGGSAQSALLWHYRMGHLGYDNLAKLQAISTGIELSPEQFAAEAATAAGSVCEPCVLAKHHKLPHPPSATQTQRPLELLHMDVCGPLPETPGRRRYFVTLYDDYTKLSLAYTLKAKSQAASAVLEGIAFLENQSGYELQEVRVDNGGEFACDALRSALKGKGVQIGSTAPFTPQQAGAAERLNRTLVEKLKAMLKAASLPDNLWAEALSTAVLLRNRSPTANRDCTPWELFFGSPPDLSNLRVFGCKAYALVPRSLRSKLDDAAWRGVLVGYHGLSGNGGYRILLPDGTLKISRDVVFNEASVIHPTVTAGSGPGGCAGLSDGSDSDSEPESPAQGGSSQASSQHGAASPASSPASSQHDAASPASSQHGAASPASSQHGSAGTDDAGSEHGSEQAGNEGSDGEEAGGQQPAAAGGRPQRTRQPSTRLLNSYTYIASGSGGDPLSYAEAMASPNAAAWQTAVSTELAAIEGRGTWSLEPLPRGVIPIKTKFVFKTKLLPDGSVDKYKARLVAQGFSQREGIDYSDELYAPVSRACTLRLIMAKAAACNLELESIDVNSAFLQGELQEEVWVSGPPGFEAKPGFAYRLLRPLYGLKQAPRAWYGTLNSGLSSSGFRPSAADPALFTRPASGSDGNGSGDYIACWVDDMTIAAPASRMGSIKALVNGKFDVTDLGPTTFTLGTTVTRDRGSGSIRLSQEHKIDVLLSDYGLEGCKPRPTPLSPGTKLSKDKGSPLDTSRFPYSRLVGSLNYLACYTRPDIAFAVGVLSRFMASPTTEHWDAAIGVLRYLAGTKGLALTYSAGGGSMMTGFCDADYAADEDTRRSVTGYVYKMFGGAISWQSKRQPTVAASTAEAEYMTAAAAVREALWLRTLLADFNLSAGPGGCVSIYCDNQATVKLLHNPMASARSKHIDVMHHFARERVQRGEVCFNFIETGRQVADGLTKALPVGKHNFCRTSMGVV